MLTGLQPIVFRSEKDRSAALVIGPARQHGLGLLFLAGAIISVLGGMIGLGCAELRLPLLIGVFAFAALHQDRGEPVPGVFTIWNHDQRPLISPPVAAWS